MEKVIEFKRNDVLPVLNKHGAKLAGWKIIDMGKKTGIKPFKAWENALDLAIGLMVLKAFQGLQVRFGKVPNCNYRIVISRNEAQRMELKTKDGEWCQVIGN